MSISRRMQARPWPHLIDWSRPMHGPGHMTLYVRLRVPSAFVHEFHHRVRLTHEPWTLETSVGQYIVLEGLAELFAKALYGEEFVGPWVTSLNAEETERARTIIGRDINVTGFDKIRSYIFGDQIAIQSGLAPVGLP